MSTSLTSTAAASEAILQPHLSARFALRWPHVLLCAMLAALFLYLNYTPLYHTDIWGHVHYGTWMLENGQLPLEDPFMPLAAGMKEIDTAWLSQLIFATVYQWDGAEGLSTIYALTVFATYLVLLRVFYLQSGRLGLSLAGMLGVLMIVWSRHAIIRPEIFGGFCCAILLSLLVHDQPYRTSSVVLRGKDRSRADRWRWIGYAALFAAWANLHGSFAAGLVVLAAISAGTWIDAARRTRSLGATLSDGPAQRSLLRLEVAAVATLLNPYGFDLLLTTLHFGQNPNLNEVLEWYPLKLVDLEGIAFAGTLLLTMGLLRHSRQRVRTADVLVFLSLAGMTALRVRMINWYAPVLFFLLIPHASSALRKFGWRRPRINRAAKETLTTRSFVGTLTAALIVWAAFSISPLSRTVLGGTPRQASHLFGSGTPLGVTEYLNSHPPKTLVFCPQWWGDWLTLQGSAPHGVFMTTHVHLAPRRVWLDYLTVARGQTGWQRVLEKYNVDTLVVHKALQTSLAQAARSGAGWRTVYEDEQALIVERE